MDISYFRWTARFVARNRFWGRPMAGVGFPIDVFSFFPGYGLMLSDSESLKSIRYVVHLKYDFRWTNRQIKFQTRRRPRHTFGDVFWTHWGGCRIDLGGQERLVVSPGPIPGNPGSPMSANLGGQNRLDEIAGGKPSRSHS